MLRRFTHFPSVVMKIVDAKENIPKSMSSILAAPADETAHPLPTNLTQPIPPDDCIQQDSYAVFDMFVWPTLNSTLTKFSIDLTGITQIQVDTSPSINATLQKYTQWLTSLHLIN